MATGHLDVHIYLNNNYNNISSVSVGISITFIITGNVTIKLIITNLSSLLIKSSDYDNQYEYEYSYDLYYFYQCHSSAVTENIFG